MPARSPPPRRRSPAPVPPAPPRISRRTPPLPGMKRGRSLDRRGGSSGPSRRREFRNGSPPHRRSRSPMRRGEPKGPPPRDFPGMPKRKLSSSPPIKKGRRDGRRPMGSPELKQTRSKSPLRERGSRSFGDMPGTSGGYSRPLGPEDEGRLTRTNDSGERFRGGVDYEEEAGLDRPIFRGPEGMVRFDPNELKRISIEIVRRNLLPPESQVINRAIVNPEDITPVRRPEMGYGDHMNESLNRSMREPSHHHRSPPRGNDMRPSSPWWNHPSDMPPHSDFNERDHPMGYPNEGSRPIFERDELMNNDRLLAPPVEQRRIVAMPPVRSRSPADRDRSRVRSPGPSREPHGYPYPGDRERSPYDSRPHPRELIDSREKRGDRYHRSDDLRHELDQRRRDEPPHYRPIPPDYREGGGGGYNRPREIESDLRARLSEKRGDPHYKHEERERERERDRERHHDIERERNRPHRSPPPPNMPPRDRRRGSPDLGPPPPPRTLEREAWERERERARERERDGDRKRRGRSRERDERRGGGGGDAGGSRRHSSLERFPEPDLERKDRSYKPDYDYGNDRHLKERDEFSSGPSRGGRGGPAVRRGMPPHAVPRGIPPRFRPPPIGIRVPPPFVPMRGFRPHMMPPPRKSSPEPAFRREKHY